MLRQQGLLVQLQLIKQHQGTQSALTCWPRTPACLARCCHIIHSDPVQLLQLQTICSNISACSPALHQQPCCYSLPDFLCEIDRETCERLHGTPAHRRSCTASIFILNSFLPVQQLEECFALCNVSILLIPLPPAAVYRICGPVASIAGPGVCILADG